MSNRVQVYLPQRAFAELQALAARRRQRVSYVVRAATIQWLVNQTGDNAAKAAQDAGEHSVGPRARRVHVRLPETVFARLAAIADDFEQTPAGWTSALLAHVLLNAPLTRHDELAALREATRQLSALGVLLNQVARALNTQLKSGRDFDPAAVPVNLIERCRAEISSVADAAHRVIETNRQVYRRIGQAGADYA
jgi:hypothetical protein